MSYEKIQSLLDTRLQALTGLPTIQLENTRNIGQTGIPFSRATLLPARATQATVGLQGRDSRTGLYQVDLFYPLDAGTATINAMADSVIDHFTRGLVLIDGAINVHVLVCWRETGRRIEPFYSVPVVIEWSCID
jgi:hypothetical protein